MSIFDKMLGALQWLKIFLSPFAVGLVLAFVSWYKYDNLYGHVGAMLLISIGAIVGIRFAENMRGNDEDSNASENQDLPESSEERTQKP